MKKRICISVLSGLLFLSALKGTVMAADTTGCMADSCEGKPAEYIADPAGAVTFENLNHRMREGNLQILALQESIDGLEEIDYDKLKEQLILFLN